ncbi:MAG: dephospho-CoA kinase [Desulfobulbaceae bacterium]|nr:dephospho-CoA kinase [Desulfobulbaceae bacterium]HIJ78836.1 dephospho-CoA kinase [Deltaproteobacteria bacterium]
MVKSGLIAITGGIGSGKSSVAAYLCEVARARCLDLDLICRDLVVPGEAGWLALREAFGDQFFLPDKTLDRPLVRRRLFADENFRRRIDELIHPLARTALFAGLENQPEPGTNLISGRVVVEVPLLFEAGWQNDFAHVVVVYADKQTIIRRLGRRDGITEIEAEQAYSAQQDMAAKALLADHVIDNSGFWWATCLQVHHLKDVFW